MRVNAKLIFKLVAIVTVPLTGYLAARGSKRYQEEMETLKMTKDEADITTADRALVAAKSYGLAAASGAASVGSILLMDHISMGELAAAGTLVAAGKKKIEKEIRRYNAYRDATLTAVGEEKESEIRQDAAKNYIQDSVTNVLSGGGATSETLHQFHLDWFGFDLYFNATMYTVLKELGEINRELFDYNSGVGHVHAVNFLRNVGVPEEMIPDEIKAYGWNSGVLAAECDCYWLPFDLEQRDDGSIYIWTPWYPNEDIDEYVEELETEGVI